MTAITLPMPTITPYANVQAEQALLGALLINNDALLHVPSWFGDKHFYEPVHKRIYSAICEVVKAGGKANPITLKSRFDVDPSLASIGGASYLINLAKGVSVIGVSDYCEVIQREWLRRELSDRCSDLLSGLAADKNPTELGAGVVAGIDSALSDTVSARAQTGFDVGSRILEALKAKEIPISTGLRKLDKAMDGGMFQKKLYTFAARKKTGKTIMAATLSANLSDQGIRHVFIATEMSSEEIYQRILARRTQSHESSFRNPYGETFSFQTKVAEVVANSKRCDFIHDAQGITFEELQQLIMVYALRFKVKGFILDYWQLIGGKPKNKSTAEHLDEVAQWLATACRKYNIFGVVMAQINQEGNTRGSEGIRLASDQVYEIHRDDLGSPLTWLEMLETRYTRWSDIGSKDKPGMIMNEHGPFFEEL